jgi:hypothetical protein
MASQVTILDGPLLHAERSPGSRLNLSPLQAWWPQQPLSDWLTPRFRLAVEVIHRHQQTPHLMFRTPSTRTIVSLLSAGRQATRERHLPAASRLCIYCQVLFFTDQLSAEMGDAISDGQRKSLLFCFFCQGCIAWAAVWAAFLPVLFQELGNKQSQLIAWISPDARDVRWGRGKGKGKDAATKKPQ